MRSSLGYISAFIVGTLVGRLVATWGGLRAYEKPSAETATTTSTGPVPCCQAEIAEAAARAKEECALFLYTMGVVEPIPWPGGVDRQTESAEREAQIRTHLARTCPELTWTALSMDCDEYPCIGVLDGVSDYPVCAKPDAEDWSEDGRYLVHLLPEGWPPSADLRERYFARLAVRRRTLLR